MSYRVVARIDRVQPHVLGSLETCTCSDDALPLDPPSRTVLYTVSYSVVYVYSVVLPTSGQFGSRRRLCGQAPTSLCVTYEVARAMRTMLRYIGFGYHLSQASWLVSSLTASLPELRASSTFLTALLKKLGGF